MRLTLESGPNAGLAVVLDRTQPVHLGSADGCELQLAGAEPQHAVIKALKDEGFGIKALAPGLHVNGRAVEVAPLHDGDLIELGGHRIAVGERSRSAAPQVAGFRILGELGRGGMGVVYRAEQQSLRREVALKVLNRELTQDQKFVQKFVAEARAAARLGHPNVVQVFDVDHDGDTYYYAMEVMHEGSLEAWLKQHGRMPVERALQVIADAAAGLAYAESLGIVHRDIKPDNLMLDRHGTVKIADLGLAHADDPGTDKLHGTPHFMAPEQVLRKGVDHRTDLYALGCTFYRLVTGRTPFRGHSVKDILRAQVKDEPEPANKVEAEVPAEVAAIIQRLLAKEPADRFQSADELIAELQVLLHPPHRKGLWISLSAAAVLIAGCAIWWAVTKPKEVKTIRERITDPVAQELYDENEQLKAELAESRARAALYEARLSGRSGRALAQAFDEVVERHPGSAAAAEARQRADEVRRQEQQRLQVEAQRREQATAAAQALAAEVGKAVAAGDFAAALQRLRQPAAEELQQEPLWQQAVQDQRQQLEAAAAVQLQALRQRIDAARTAGDPEALAAALPPLAAVLDERTGWPRQLLPEPAAQRQFLQAAQRDVAALQQQRLTAGWQRFDETLRAAVRPKLFAGDFAGAAQAARALAAEETAAVQNQRAVQLAGVLELAAKGAEDLAAAAEKGNLQLLLGDGQQLQVARVDWSKACLLLVDPQKRPPKEQPLAFADLQLSQWLALASQLPATTPGSRECLLGVLALDLELRHARDYLQRLQVADDASGTGSNGYRAGDCSPDALLRLLPGDEVGWATALRAELGAGRTLAAGLRALSERRNLAAATHLEHLLRDHPHSLLVAALGGP